MQDHLRSTCFTASPTASSTNVPERASTRIATLMLLDDDGELMLLLDDDRALMLLLLDDDRLWVSSKQFAPSSLLTRHYNRCIDS